jgi:hypothetical protein
MFTWIILFWAWVCPNPNHTSGNHGNCNLIHISASAESDDTGGETGNLPPKPPTPPPPPPGS